MNSNIESCRDPEVMPKKSLHSGRETIKFGIILFLICLISAGLLSFVYGLTKEKILNQKRTEEAQILKEVLAGAVKIEEAASGDLVYYVGLNKENKEIGKAIITTARGYAGDIVICAGINKDGKILAIKILSHGETPGLGSRVAEPGFLDKFKHRSASEIGAQDAITGATISSTAVINSIKGKAEELFRKIK